MPYGNSIRVRLPADLANWVRERARQEGRTTSEVVREAVDAYLQQQAGVGQGRAHDEQTDDEEEDSLHVRLPAALRLPRAEQVIRRALHAYRAAPPPLRAAPTAAVEKPTHDIIIRIARRARAGLEALAEQNGVGVSAVIRHALMTARQTMR
jgi:Arc/MetJ-type ribon-helix-helix transcriptional regulator